MQSTIELAEYEDSDPLELSADELEALGGLLPSLTIKPAGEGTFVLNPAGVVGVGEVGQRRITIRPKIGINRLMFLIAYSLDPVRWQTTFPSFKAEPDVLEAMVPAYVAAVRRATGRGILRGYEERSEPLATVRGRIDLDSLVQRRYGVFPPIDCRFDEYTADIEMNRMLLAASDRLLRLRRLGTAWTSELRAVRSLFNEVSLRRYAPHAVPAVTYTRLTNHYRPAVELARLLLRELSVEIGPAPVRARGFFVDVAQVFEDFVVTALREALGVSERAFPQGAHGRLLHLDLERAIRLEPDLSWWDGQRCVFVGDAKYKETPSGAGVKHPDIYQLFAYAQATDLPGGLLVYAAGESRRRRYRIVHSDKTLDVRTLDLIQDPKAVLAEIDELATHIRSIRPANVEAVLAR